MTSKENVKASLDFTGCEWLPHDFPEPWGTDIIFVKMQPSPDDRPANGVDEWGAGWENIGVCKLGEVKQFPYKDGWDFEHMTVPDVTLPKRWEGLKDIRSRYPDKFLLGEGISLYERIHFIRGLEETWCDIYEAPDSLKRMLDILLEMNLKAVEKYHELDIDGLFMTDDWGLQNSLIISPEKWREIWKPYYARLFATLHEKQMYMVLHSCGYIVDILDDLIEIGLDAVHMDQQENMGLENLGKRFAGKLNFFAPVDIQHTMLSENLEDIRAYCREMAKQFLTAKGGFIPRWYTDPEGVGHRQENIDAMCEEFLKISMEVYGK